MFTSVSLEYPVDDVGGEKEPYPPTPLQHMAHFLAKDHYRNKHSKLAIGTLRGTGVDCTNQQLLSKILIKIIVKYKIRKLYVCSDVDEGIGDAGVRRRRQ